MGQSGIIQGARAQPDGVERQRQQQPGVTCMLEVNAVCTNSLDTCKPRKSPLLGIIRMWTIGSILEHDDLASVSIPLHDGPTSTGAYPQKLFRGNSRFVRDEVGREGGG